MRAREVVEVAGGEPSSRKRSRRCRAARRRPDGPRLRTWAAIEESAAAVPRGDRGAAGVRDTPYDRAERTTIATAGPRRWTRDGRPATAGPRRRARDALPGGSPSSPHGLPVATTELGLA